MAEINPYRAPQASVADVGQAEGVLLAEPRGVDTSRGVAWLADGWARFRQIPLVWIAIIVIAFVIFVALNVIPVVGGAVTTLLTILFSGGIMLGCRAMDRGEELTVGHLFAGFRSHLNPLLVVGALYLAGLFTAAVIASLATGGTIFALLRGGPEVGSTVTGLLLLILVMAALMLPIAMAVWFAPALVVLHDIAPVQAMKQSLIGCLRNILPFLVYGVLGLVLAFVATIPFGLGWLVLMPVLAGSVYAAYLDIFVQR